MALQILLPELFRDIYALLLTSGEKEEKFKAAWGTDSRTGSYKKKFPRRRDAVGLPPGNYFHPPEEV